MTFQETLNSYMTRIGCTGKELASASGVAPSVVSRYRTGIHSPDMDGEQWRKLAEGLAALAEERGVRELAREEIEDGLRQALLSEGEQAERDRSVFHQNLNALLDDFEVGNTELAQFLRFDRSHIVRIRAGERAPRDMGSFSLSVGYHIVRKCRGAEDLARLSAFLGADLRPDAPEQEYAGAVARYLMPNSEPPSTGSIVTLLRKMDEFDLDEYIRVIHFDKMKVPTAPIQLPSSHVYTGLKELMDAQLDFLKTTVLSRSDEDVTMYSDLPMTEMSRDAKFPKNWMLGMAAMLKKGLRLNMIHDVERPLHEMMLGLESYIPMYMTGQISPYYLPGKQNSVFRHMLWVSGDAALQGECVADHIREGRMYLTSRRSEVAGFRVQAGQLLDQAAPLMEIYGIERQAAFRRFRSREKNGTGPRRSILSMLPVYTLSEELAACILDRNGVPEPEREVLMEHIREERQRMEAVLKHSTVSDTLPEIAADEYSRWPMSLPLADIFYQGEIRLTYEEYAEHLALCDAFAETHPGYTCLRDRSAPFRNIQIVILEGERAVISKNKSPAIHFVIRHPRLVEAIENMVMPITD